MGLFDSINMANMAKKVANTAASVQAASDSDEKPEVSKGAVEALAEPDIKTYVDAVYNLQYNDNANLSDHQRDEYQATVDNWNDMFAEGGTHSKYGFLSVSDSQIDSGSFPSNVKDKLLANQKERELEEFEKCMEDTIPWYGLTPEEYETYQKIGSSKDAEAYRDSCRESHKENGEHFNIKKRDFSDSVDRPGYSRVCDEINGEIGYKESSESSFENTVKERAESLWDKVRDGAKEITDWVKGTTVFAYASEGISNIKDFVSTKVLGTEAAEHVDSEKSDDKTKERAEKADAELGTGDMSMGTSEKEAEAGA